MDEIPPEPGTTTSAAQGGTVTAVATSIAAFVGFAPEGPTDEPTRLTSWRDYTVVFGGFDGGEMGYAVKSFYDNGGTEAWFVRVSGETGGDDLALIGDAAAKTGLYALDGVDSFNLLCLPDLRRLTGGAYLEAAVASAAYCRGRRAFLILDLPAEIDTVEAAQSWATNTAPELGSENRSYAAAYWPEPLVPDPLDSEEPRRIATSGIMAAVYARSDRETGVWQAPAGTTQSIAGVLKLAVALDDDQNSLINPLGLNALRTFPVYGTVPWGARTLQGADTLASDWKYVAERRLALLIEESFVRGLAWTVYEPNGPQLWSAIRRNSTPFLDALWRQGAFVGATPSASYFLTCDSTTTSQADIEAGTVNVVVGFAPTRPAEFTVLTIPLKAEAPGG